MRARHPSDCIRALARRGPREDGPVLPPDSGEPQQVAAEAFAAE